MSEYWKSTPRYWCKHCSIYVRDTGLERKNHEATGKHQGALKRFLRDIHRDHEKGEREKERAKREVERLNGVVSGGSSSSNNAAGGSGSGSGHGKVPPAPAPSLGGGSGGTAGPATRESRQKQWEQLADMGIDVPTELRGDMAMAGGWTVTNTRVIDDEGVGGEDGEEKLKNVDAIATGTRKRAQLEVTEEDERRAEEEKAVQGLFKKPRRWGRDSKQAGGEDKELDKLLSGTLVPMKVAKADEEAQAKKEEEAGEKSVKTEREEAKSPKVKAEAPEDDDGIEGTPLPTGADGDIPPLKKEEPDDAPSEASAPPIVMFKKRKGKDNIRQKKPLK